MTDILPPAGWPNVRQLETNEFASGGANGNMNEQAKSLAARSELLKQYAALPYESKTGGYALNERVQLATGDIVRSTIPNNVNNPNVDMTGWVNESNAVKNRIVWFEDFVSDATGVIDVTAEMQSLLDSHDGDIYAKSDSVFKTSNTLFNRKHNRTIDFHNAKIVNKSNSRYSIVTISPAFTGSTDAELNTFVTERHYGNEVRASHIKNLRYEMSSKSEVGANLGVGIVYGYKCFASKLYPIMTNGNGFEIRNSLQCGIYDSEIEGHRNYTCFIFMSKKCFVIRNKLKGGMRGVSTKMNRDGDPNCDHVIAFNTFEDSTSVARSIIGGEWRETNLTDEIYVSGHEWVDGNLIYGNTFINNARPQTIHAACFSRNWKVYNNTFDWNNLGGQIMNFGGEGNVVNGEALGGSHEFYSNTIYDYDANNNAIIIARLSNRVYGNHFYNCKALYWYNSDADYAGNALDHAEFFRNHFVGGDNGVYAALNEQHGFVAKAGVKTFKFNDNDGTLNVLLNGAYKSAAVVTSRAQSTQIAGGDIKFLSGAGVESVVAALVLVGSVDKLSDRKVSISAPVTSIALQIQAGVNVNPKHENNTYVLVGSSATSRAVVTATDFVDGVNTYTGAWVSRVFNNFSKPVGMQRNDRQSSLMPTSETYQKGDFIRNTNPSIVANAVVFGWLRITNGSNHVLNTDWVEIKQSTV